MIFFVVQCCRRSRNSRAAHDKSGHCCKFLHTLLEYNIELRGRWMQNRILHRGKVEKMRDKCWRQFQIRSRKPRSRTLGLNDILVAHIGLSSGRHCLLPSLIGKWMKIRIESLVYWLSSENQWSYSLQFLIEHDKSIDPTRLP